MEFVRKLNRPVDTSIGMFDLLKGMAMLLIVFVHNRSIFPTLMLDEILRYRDAGIVNYLPNIVSISIVGRLCFAVIGAILVSIMPALFVFAGYSVRKRNITKCFSLQFKELLKPYLIATFVTVIINFVLHFCFFRYLPGAARESLKVLGGMLLGFSQNVQVGEITFFANGPIWFVLSLFWSLVIFNIILNKVDESQIKYYVLGLSVIGWLLSYTKSTPFCLSQGLIGILYVWFGYYLRKAKILTSEHDRDSIIKYILWVIIPNLIITFFGLLTEMADNVYSLGPINYIENGLMGIGVIYVYLRINQSINGKVSNALRYLGRYSLYFMIIHTVEMIAVPWYVFAGKFESHQITGFFVLYVIRIIFIILALVGVNKIMTLYKKVKSRK